MKPLIGKVISAKTAKTVTVEVKRFKVHPIYLKRVGVKKRFHAHDPLGVEEGETVKIAETRPISKTKKWQVVAVVKK